MNKLEKQILEILRKNNYPDGENDDDVMCAKEIASLMWQKPDINTPFFGNSGVKIDENYLNECIEKATPNLSKIKDVDKELDEIRGVKYAVTEHNSYPKEFLEWIDASMKNGVTLRKVYGYWKTNIRDK